MTDSCTIQCLYYYVLHFSLNFKLSRNNKSGFLRFSTGTVSFHCLLCFTFNSNTTFMVVHPESAMCTTVGTFTKVNVSFIILSEANRDVIWSGSHIKNDFWNI